MVEDMPEDEGPALDSGRAKRAPPTIDLEASEVSGETRKAGDDARPERISGEQSSEAPSSREPPARAISAWVIAVVSGAVAAALNDVKTTPRDSSAPLDLTDINARIAGLESATRAQSAEAVQQNAKPADDVPLRRVVASALLDVLVRIGEPYPAALAAAKSLAPNPDALKPLDGFAAKGVPSPAGLSRELLTLVSKLSPPAPENATTGSGLVERLQAGAAKLVRIERTDTAGNDRGAVVARATAAALRNEFNEARRELNTLAPADRAAARAWLDKCDARDAALAASRQFAAEAMAALAKPAP